MTANRLRQFNGYSGSDYRILVHRDVKLMMGGDNFMKNRPAHRHAAIHGNWIPAIHAGITADYKWRDYP